MPHYKLDLKLFINKVTNGEPSPIKYELHETNPNMYTFECTTPLSDPVYFTEEKSIVTAIDTYHRRHIKYFRIMCAQFAFNLKILLNLQKNINFGDFFSVNSFGGKSLLYNLVGVMRRKYNDNGDKNPLNPSDPSVFVGITPSDYCSEVFNCGRNSKFPLQPYITNLSVYRKDSSGFIPKYNYAFELQLAYDTKNNIFRYLKINPDGSTAFLNDSDFSEEYYVNEKINYDKVHSINTFINIIVSSLFMESVNYFLTRFRSDSKSKLAVRTNYFQYYTTDQQKKIQLLITACGTFKNKKKVGDYYTFLDNPDVSYIFLANLFAILVNESGLNPRNLDPRVSSLNESPKTVAHCKVSFSTKLNVLTYTKSYMEKAYRDHNIQSDDNISETSSASSETSSMSDSDALSMSEFSDASSVSSFSSSSSGLSTFDLSRFTSVMDSARSILGFAYSFVRGNPEEASASAAVSEEDIAFKNFIASALLNPNYTLKH
uniref:Uncharacterized protein n=1 Tax=viral metagenome TaxID=1070528 RepID=A0A6C0E7K4_9ZZZZ